MAQGTDDRGGLSVPVLQACDESWSAMSGDERVRRCASCNKDVHDLSALSTDEAAAFLDERRSRLPCLRLAQDHEGRTLFRDDLARIARRVAAFGAAASLAACAQNNPPAVTHVTGAPRPQVGSAAPTQGSASNGSAASASSAEAREGSIRHVMGEAAPADLGPVVAPGATGEPAAVRPASSGVRPPPQPTPQPGRMLTGKPVPSSHDSE